MNSKTVTNWLDLGRKFSGLVVILSGSAVMLQQQWPFG